MFISFSRHKAFQPSSVTKQWHIIPHCKTYDWNNVKMTTTCEGGCRVLWKHSEIITYYKVCLGKQQFASHPQNTTLGRRPVAVGHTHRFPMKMDKTVDDTQQPAWGYFPSECVQVKEHTLFRLFVFCAC